MFKKIGSFISIICDPTERNELGQLFRDQIYFARPVSPLTKDLSELNGREPLFPSPDYQFLEMKLEELSAGKLTFSMRSRYLGALRKLRKGLRGFALIYHGTVIGDIWYMGPLDRHTPIGLPELDTLGIARTPTDGYTLGMFIDPAFRGKNLAVPLHQALQSVMKKEGYRRIFACYFDDNTSSKWMHFMLKFKALPKLRQTRIFSYCKTYQVSTDPSETA